MSAVEHDPDHYKNVIIAKLAAKVSYPNYPHMKMGLAYHWQVAAFYQSSVRAINDASPPIKHAFPSVRREYALIRF